VLLLDIGGGSMEIVLGRDAERELAVSVPLGADRLSRAFLPDDPPKRCQQASCANTFETPSERSATGCAGRVNRTWPWPRPSLQTACPTGRRAPPQRMGPFVRRSVTLTDLGTWIPRLARRTMSERTRAARNLRRPRPPDHGRRHHGAGRAGAG
jgi:exopolyphosphatase/guanosine-5'-triphosphate,3'-diphosphate pyrophosphatase